MRTQTLIDETRLNTDDVTGTSFRSYPDHYETTKGVNVSTSGVVTFDLKTQNVTATLQGSISGDSAEFVNIKTVSRSGSNVLEGHTVAIFPFMRVSLSGVTAGAVIKVMIAYP